MNRVMFGRKGENGKKGERVLRGRGNAVGIRKKTV